MHQMIIARLWDPYKWPYKWVHWGYTPNSSLDLFFRFFLYGFYDDESPFFTTIWEKNFWNLFANHPTLAKSRLFRFFYSLFNFWACSTFMLKFAPFGWVFRRKIQARSKRIVRSMTTLPRPNFSWCTCTYTLGSPHPPFGCWLVTRTGWRELHVFGREILTHLRWSPYSLKAPLELIVGFVTCRPR